MSYQVIARKWRPNDFTQLVGQDHVAQTLMNALKSERLAHALLFTGPRGTGKTSSARILAKSLRCLNVKDFIPCQKCSECEDISLGRSLNVIEIDGASNNGVDAIRELRENLGFAPSSGTYKVYIIDEVHMLTTSAFNALLKSLEEPPPHVIFIMATTEAHKIPNTILSRCQRFDFRLITSHQIQEQLKHIVKKEGFQFDQEALWLISKQARGSMRDAQSLLDQMVTFCDGNITKQQVTEALGLTDRGLLMDTLEAVVAQDGNALIDLAEKIYFQGLNPQLFFQDLLEQWRNVQVIKHRPQMDLQLVDIPESEWQQLKTLSEKISQEDIHLLFDLTIKGSQDLLYSESPQVVLEMVLLRMAHAPRVLDLVKALQSGVQLSSQSILTSPVSGSSSASSSATFMRPVAAGMAKANTSNGPTSSTATVAPNPSLGSGDKQARWFDLVQKIKTANGFLGALLENTAIEELDNKQVVLSLPKKVHFLSDKLEDPQNIKRIQTFIKTFWQQKLEVKIQKSSGTSVTMSAPGVGSHLTPESASVSGVPTVSKGSLQSEAVSPATPKELEEKRKQDKISRERKEILADPKVQFAVQAFDGEVSEIKPMNEDKKGDWYER